MKVEGKEEEKKENLYLTLDRHPREKLLINNNISTTLRRQKSICLHDNTKKMIDETVLLKIMGHGARCMDVIARGLCYQNNCMKEFMNRILEGKNKIHYKFTWESTLIQKCIEVPQKIIL